MFFKSSWKFRDYLYLIEPLLSRFVIVHVPDYSFEEFTNIAISRLAKEKVNRDIATIIAEKVWRTPK
jgi:hypothetical protein